MASHINQFGSIYFLQHIESLSLSIFCGGLFYNFFVENPSRAECDKISTIKSLSKSIEYSKYFIPIFLLPGIICLLICYYYLGNFLYLISAILTGMILPIDFFILIEAYEKIKNWSEDRELDIMFHEIHINNTLRKIRFWDFVKCFIFIIAFSIDLYVKINLFDNYEKSGKLKQE